MVFYYSESLGRHNVPPETPMNEPASIALEVYRDLDPKRGFLCISVSSHTSIQFLCKKAELVCIELLDQSTASFDSAQASPEFGETLIHAIEEGKDVFSLARSSLSGWKHVELNPSAESIESSPPLLPELANENTVFTATEAGFEDGLGGASNSKSGAEKHYVLFGIQQDPQHAWNSGVYFEFDGQKNGRVNSVQKVIIGKTTVAFFLENGTSIDVRCGVNEHQWSTFEEGIRTVFPEVDWIGE